MSLKKEYRYILFDLDRTLWDFDSNAKNNIFQLLEKFKVPVKDKFEFFTRYDEVNHKLWPEYERGELKKEDLRWQRFHKTLLMFGIDDIPFAKEFGDVYLEEMPNQNILMPHSKEVLETLYNKGVKMAIITNGFKEVQYRKLKNCGIDHYFSAVMISEEQGVHKPSPVLFKRALNAINGEKESSLMVGDDFANDIEGAMIFGIDQFFYNYKKIPCDGGPTYDSSDLRDLISISPL